jgi:hypothetical protein
MRHLPHQKFRQIPKKTGFSIRVPRSIFLLKSGRARWTQDAARSAIDALSQRPMTMVEPSCAALGAIRSIPLRRMRQNGLKAAWRTRQAPSEAKLDNEFYQERARHIRELADKADPFIRKRLLDLAGNYDSIVRRSPRTTAIMPPNLPGVPAGNNPASDTMPGRSSASVGDGKSGGI